MKLKKAPLTDEVRPIYAWYLDKVRKDHGWTHRDLAIAMKTPEALIDKRINQLEHFFADGTDPRTSFAKAVERALGLNLPPEDYGWDPNTP